MVNRKGTELSIYCLTKNNINLHGISKILETRKTDTYFSPFPYHYGFVVPFLLHSSFPIEVPEKNITCTSYKLQFNLFLK